MGAIYKYFKLIQIKPVVSVEIIIQIIFQPDNILAVTLKVKHTFGLLNISCDTFCNVCHIHLGGVECIQTTLPLYVHLPRPLTLWCFSFWPFSCSTLAICPEGVNLFESKSISIFDNQHFANYIFRSKMWSNNIIWPTPKFVCFVVRDYKV